MNILLTGATGFVGRVLSRKLIAAGHEVTALARRPERAARLLPEGVGCLHWEAGEAGEAAAGEAPADADLVAALGKADALVHLAGESVAAGRWSARRRRRIHDTRGPAMRRLREAAAQAEGGGPGVILSASAVGYYGDRGGEELEETSPPGAGFLAEVCRDWEGALLDGPADGKRRAAFRIGMVLGRGGGAMARLLPVFRVGLGGRLGNGRQWMSWIHVEDLTELLLHALQTPSVSGVLNAVAPQPVTNGEFTRTLAGVLRRPALLPAPAFALRLLLGEMSTILLESQRALPRAALAQGFSFRYPDLRTALEEVCGKG